MNVSNVVKTAVLAGLLTGCASAPVETEEIQPAQPTVVWKLPPNLGKSKSDVGILMSAPLTTDGGQLPAGLAQQFVEAVQSKMIQSKRFHVTLPNQFGEVPQDGDSDVVVKPFVDIIQQPMRTGSGREGVANICKISLDVKIFDKADGEATDAINLDGVSPKVIVPSVFGKPAREVDTKGLVVKAYEEAYKLLEKEINKYFPAAAAVVSSRTVAVPPPPTAKAGDPKQEPMLKLATRGGANIGFKPETKYMLFTMVDDTAVVIALLDADSIMDEKASFRSVLLNDTDPEAYDVWSRIKAKEDVKLFVTPYFN